MSTDAVTEWRAAHERVCDLVLSLDADALADPVPATPDWSVHDLFAHMVGLGADVVAGDEPDDHNATWTQAQVDARRGRSASDVVAEWREVAPRLGAWMAAHGPRPLADLTIHEQDLRGALDRPGARETRAVEIVREAMLRRFATAVADLPPVLLDTGSWHWVSSGDPDDASTALRLSGIDLFRALTSRRSAEQLRGWTVRGDVQPYLGAFAGLGPLPDHPLPGE